MKIELLSKENNGLKSFTCKCIDNKWVHGWELFKKHWIAASNIDDFCKRVFSDTNLMNTQGYAELSKERHGHRQRLLSILDNADMHFTIYSDAGSVLIGNKDISFLISHRNGDGGALVAVFNEPNKFNDNMLNYVTLVEGKNIQIHEYDCDISSEVKATLSGVYQVYAGYGTVVFVKIREC